MTDLNKRTDLLEREADLEQIGGALRSAAAGSGGIVVIEGEPGIGNLAAGGGRGASPRSSTASSSAPASSTV
jgi:hypothetical protein